MSRFGELGVFVKEGRMMFNPRLLRKGEFLKTPETFTYTNINKEVKEIESEGMKSAKELGLKFSDTPIGKEVDKINTSILVGELDVIKNGLKIKI